MIIKCFKYFFLRIDKVDILVKFDVVLGDSFNFSFYFNLVNDYECESSIIQFVSEIILFKFIIERWIEEMWEMVNE